MRPSVEASVGQSFTKVNLDAPAHLRHYFPLSYQGLPLLYYTHRSVKVFRRRGSRSGPVTDGSLVGRLLYLIMEEKQRHELNQYKC